MGIYGLTYSCFHPEGVTVNNEHNIKTNHNLSNHDFNELCPVWDLVLQDELTIMNNLNDDQSLFHIRHWIHGSVELLTIL